MRDDRENSGGAGVVIAAVAVAAVLLVCGGGALAAAGLFFFRMSAAHVAAPPPASTAVSSAPTVQSAAAATPAHTDILAIDAEGMLLFNDAPITTAELRERLDELKKGAGPPRPMILRADEAPAESRDEVVQLLSDRGVRYIVQE
jgi:biopolymer transport protein ExbD